MNSFLLLLSKILSWLYPLGKIDQKPAPDQSPFERGEEIKPTPVQVPETVADAVETPIVEQSESNEQECAFVVRLVQSTKDSTVSELVHRGVKLCYILEDGKRDVKVYGQTRIPAGTYELIKRKSGRFYTKYKKEFGHEYVVELKDVPNFKYILVHIGNTIKDTLGCLLTGGRYLQRDGVISVLNSTEAYLKWYAAVDSEFKKGRVFIRIVR